MIIVLLCGGAGTRLWPISTPQHPKQFQRLLQGPNDTKQSMVERMWEQLKSAGLDKSTYICTGQMYSCFLKEQIPSVEIIEEPYSRNSFPAIFLSCTYLLDTKNINSDEPIIFLPIDHYVDEEYFKALTLLPSVLNSSQADIVLMGKQPNSAATKFGYIIKSNAEDGYSKVAGFHEKPEKQDAQALYSSGALWNMGVFCMRAGFLRDNFSDLNVPQSYSQLFANYDMLPKISFDHKVLEHSTNLAVVPFYDMWSDLGTWDDLLNVLQVSENQNYVMENCTSTFVLNTLPIPVVCDGICNLAIIVSEEGILIRRR